MLRISKTMSNNGCSNLGALQTRGTCWFYSILNGFILSENGVKILYSRLKEIYASLKPEEKAYFNSNLNAYCPVVESGPRRILYFWKFLDQYLCFHSGPRPIHTLRRSKSITLLSGVNIQGERARLHGGLKGAFPREEISKVLDHIGFRDKYYILSTTSNSNFDGRKRPQFVIVVQSSSNKKTMITFPTHLMANPNYSLMCASLTISNRKLNKSAQNGAHSVAGYICNGKGYIFDSNSPTTFKCDWWDKTEYKRVVDAYIAPKYKSFKNGQITNYEYEFAIFARNEFTKPISPSCIRRGRAKKINANNQALMNKALLNAKSYNSGMTEIQSLMANGIIINSATLTNFRRKLRTKFPLPPLPLNKPVYNTIINEANSYNNGIKRIESLLRNGTITSIATLTNLKSRLRAKFPNGAGPSRQTNNSGKNK